MAISEVLGTKKAAMDKALKEVSVEEHNQIMHFKRAPIHGRGYICARQKKALEKIRRSGACDGPVIN